MTKRDLEQEVQQLRESLRMAQAKIQSLEIQAGVLDAHIMRLIAAVQPVLQ